MPLAAGPARFRYSGTEGPYCWYRRVLVGLADHALAIAASSAGEKSLVNKTLGCACLTFERTEPQSGTAPSLTPSLLTWLHPSCFITESKPLAMTVPYVLLPLMIEYVFALTFSWPARSAPSTPSAKPWPYHDSVGPQWKIPQYLDWALL